MSKVKICKKTVCVENRSVVFEFQDGAKTKVEVFIDQFSDNIILMAKLHGISQKLGDSFSQSEGSVSVAMKKFDDCYSSLQRSEWNVRSGGILVEAFARASGRSLEECREKAAELDEKALKKLKDDLAVVIKTIEKERAEAKEPEEEVDFGKYF